MAESAMNVIPQIQSLGLPPQQHADRVTSAMLHWIIRERESRELSSVGRKLAIALPDHMGDAVAVIVKHDDPEILAMVVATILDPEMV